MRELGGAVLAHVGGNFNNGANDGLFYWNLNNTSSNTNINIGSRLLIEINKLYMAHYFPHLLVKISREQAGLVGKPKDLQTINKKMKRYNNLFDEIVDKENIINAIHKASKRKRKRKTVQKILANDEYYADKIREMLINKTFKVNPYIVSVIYDGASHKERTIYKPSFYPDQVIHWALMLVIEPLLKKRMYYYSCASIKGRGNKHGIKATKKILKSNPRYCLKIDVKKFYPSIDTQILKDKFHRIFKDVNVLWLIDAIIDGHHTQGTGVPIGNYTSQWFANIYLTETDLFIVEKLKLPLVRNMDDMTIYSNNKRQLWKAKGEIERFLQKERLNLKGSWQLFNCDKRPIDFLGYRFYKTHTTLRRSNFLRIKRRMKKIAKKSFLNFKDACAVVSYFGLLKQSNCFNYMGCYVYPYVSLKKCKEVIRNESKCLIT